MKEKIGVGITTYNTEHYLKALYESIPHDRIDELVIVNGGDPYIDDYDKADMIQHCSNHYPSVCRNDCMRYLIGRNCDHIFIIEDDMVLKSPDIFDTYIETSKKTGLKYFCFASTSWGSGEPGNRTPKATIDYGDVKIALYPNMCNEFTYHNKETIKLYDEQFRYVFDIDSAFRYARDKIGTPFWWFADVIDSDKLIENNPETETRINEGGKRDKALVGEWKMFYEKHQAMVQQIPNISLPDVKKVLKEIYENSHRN